MTRARDGVHSTHSVFGLIARLTHLTGVETWCWWSLRWLQCEAPETGALSCGKTAGTATLYLFLSSSMVVEYVDLYGSSGLSKYIEERLTEGSEPGGHPTLSIVSPTWRTPSCHVGVLHTPDDRRTLRQTQTARIPIVYPAKNTHKIKLRSSPTDAVAVPINIPKAPAKDSTFLDRLIDPRVFNEF